jgi:hypothetical protein
MTKTFCAYGANRDETLVAYLYGDIAPAERAAFESHLATCSTCHDELEELGGVRRQLSRWAPPELRTTVRVPTAPSVFAPGPGIAAGAPRKRWDEVPVWAQVAAAVLVLGAAAGAANLNIHYGQDGFSVQTGWIRPAPARSETATSAASQAPWRADLTRLDQQLRADLRPVSASAPAETVAGAGTSDADLLRKVRALINESEKRQQTELALRIGQVSHDFQSQRLVDLTNIDRNLKGIQSTTGFAVEQQRQYINALRVSLTQVPQQQRQ